MNLFTAFDGEWSLEVLTKPDNSRLVRRGSLEEVQNEHPDVVARLHTAGLRRN